MNGKPRILSSIPGRIRIHLPHWSGHGQRCLEQRIRKLPGVRRVEANSLTGNILVGFDPQTTNENAILSALNPADWETNGHADDKPLPPVIHEGVSGSMHQARIAVRGLDRDPHMAAKVLEHLRKFVNVRVRASQLTGRILVEYDANQVDLHELLAKVSDVELPDLPGEDRPAHPLDRAPLLHAAARTIGAALGLSLIVARRLAGWTATSRQVKIAATTAGILGLARSFPSLRNGLRQVLGIHAADLVFSTTSVITLALAGSPLGLTVTGLEGLFLLTEVMARRSAWRRYEDSLHGTASAEPGAVIRLEAEERLPLPAQIIEGTGTAIGRDGLPRQIAPGAHVSAGAELSGGPFVVQLEGGKPFLPRPRPAPPHPSFYSRYVRILGPISLGYAAMMALLSRSLGRTFEALLLVNPRPAIIGMEAANLDAAARVLRAGVTVVGTRPDRAIPLPDALLLDGPRVLTDGLEVTTVLPLDESLNESDVLALAGSMSVAAGSPWGDVFPRANKSAEGAFNGLWIAASVEGKRYILGPPDDPPAVGEAVERRAEGGYLLMLAREEDERALGLVALRPRRNAEGTPASGGVHGDGLEITTVLPMDESVDASQVLALARNVSSAAGSPWGSVFPPGERPASAGWSSPHQPADAGRSPQKSGSVATEGSFNGLWAAASVDGVRYTLGPPEDTPAIGEAVERQHEGGYLLMLSREEDWRPLGFVTLRPRLHPSTERLVQTCRRLGVRLEMLAAGAPVAAQAVARRAGVILVNAADAVAVMSEHQQAGEIVAFVSDSAQAAPGFADCDLGIGLAPSPAGQFPARADLLALDLDAVAAVLEAGARRQRAVRDGVFFSAAANLFGAVWGMRGRPGVERASHAVYISALGALADGWLRLRGGQRPESSVSRLVDPHPERWGRRSIASVLRTLKSSETGLSTKQAKQRRAMVPRVVDRQALLKAVLDEMRSPVNGILTGGALLSLIAGGAALDIVIIGATVAINVTVAVWQERQAGKAVEALRRLGTTTARVVRDGVIKTVPASDVVEGDVLLLAPGDRVAADARLMSAHALEVDEAALTGESVPVVKQAETGPPDGRVVLEGSGVVVGTGRVVAVAVGRQTRLGATAAALSHDETQESPFGQRLARLLQMALPIAVAGGATVIASGILWGKPLVSQISVGASIALAVVPESLPLLAGTGQVGVARRLAGRRALLRSLPAVEALGRVDVACTDKTGTLTEGRLAVSLVAAADSVGWVESSRSTGEGVVGLEDSAHPTEELTSELRRVLLTAALASPHPDAADAVAHPTDVAVIAAARTAGLVDELSQPHQREEPFEPDRAFHTAVVGDRLRLKGAPEAVCPRCTLLRRGGADQPLDDAGRQRLLEEAHAFSARGLRILMIADGPPDTSVDDPQQLRALGFIGISDPLRPSVADAVRRCREAGVRVIMITGDHPATARAIAREAGLLDGGDILTGAELGELDNEELDHRMENATVIARATPLDKLRIIESLRRRGHTVAMTGDGVNDAPALRLADVGVSMGRGGTEVARQAADVVLADDDFATLVEALVEGRGFWRNMRRALGLLLGGNLGELGLIVGTTALGFDSPLNTRQILAVNLITDALPALSVVLQQPEHRNLAALAREGTTALDDSLRRDVFRRGTATALPALAAYLLSRSNSTPAQSGAVAFGTIVATQLAQTLDAGWSEGTLNLPVLGAVSGSAAFLASTLTLSPMRNLLGLAMPTAAGWSLIGGGAVAAVALSRILAAGSGWVAKSTGEGRLTIRQTHRLAFDTGAYEEKSDAKTCE